MNKYFTLLLLMIVPEIIMAQKIVSLGDGLSFTIPMGFKEIPNKTWIYSGIDSAMCTIVITRIDKQDYDAFKVKQKADRMIFNLKDYYKTDEETDGILQSGRDFVFKYYKNNQNMRIATYTSYVYEFPYVILFSYKNDSDLAKLQSVLSSEDYNSSWWHEMWTFVRKSAGTLCIAFFFIPFICILIKNSVIGSLLGLLVGLWITWPIISHLTISLPLILIGVLYGFGFSDKERTLGDFAKEIVNNI